MGMFTMPSLGADMDSGRLTDWLVAPGDEVHRGQIIAVVDTAKSAIEVEVFEDGRVGELLVEPGTQVPVGTPLATIVATSETAVEPPVPPEPPPREPAQPEPAPAPEPAVTRATPIAPPPVRHLAHQLGVDIESVTGSGPGGKITRDDVQRAAAVIEAPALRRRVTPRARRLAQQRGVNLSALDATIVTGDQVPQVQAPAKQTEPPDRRDSMRLATARLMARSAREIPHYYVSTTVDLRPMTQWLAAHNAALPVRERVLPIAVLLRAVCRAAVAVPELNGHWIDEAFVPGDGVHLGVATATRGGGLLTPSLRDAQQLGVDALMAALSDVIRRARKGSLRSSEISPGTVTVSSLADGGPDALFGVIYPPQVALVGIGGIAERPWAVDGMLTVRPTATITLAADHRATDGRTGAAFLQAMGEALQQPEER